MREMPASELCGFQGINLGGCWGQVRIMVCEPEHADVRAVPMELQNTPAKL